MMSSLSNLTSSPIPIPISVPTTSPPRPVVILPGLGNSRGDYGALAAALREKHGVAAAVVAEVARVDWLRNAAGILDPDYWTGTLRPRPVLDWYLERVDRAVAQAKSLAPPGQGISLIGHSAGGWLARVYMEEFGFDGIALLLTLGSPHLPPPKNVPGVIDQTRGLLDYVEKNCAPAVYTPELRYVCIAGRYIQGARLIGNSKPAPEETLEIGDDLGQDESIVSGRNNKPAPSAPTLRARFVGQGYKQVCGQADVWGDGVVPEMSAHLDGALNISLDGVYHSPVGSDDNLRPWFGCLSREYRYFFWKGNLDIPKMQEAAVKFIGEHDFRNFCKMDAANVSNYRRKITNFNISSCNERSNDDELWAMTIKGSAFLWHQVRCMIAVLFMIGQGPETPSIVDALLDTSKTPRKPQYNMAPELPLVLRSCEFENISFTCSLEASKAVTEHLMSEYRNYMLQAAIHYEALGCLCSPDNSSQEPDRKNRGHIPLLLRQTEPSYEERLAKFNAKGIRRRSSVSSSGNV